jgi:DNA sulfur modification protein DndD
VILDQLVLENIGVFAGRNEIDLAPPGEDRPVILFGGLNGAGKTTILESIHLALYGSLTEGSSRRVGKSYESYLRSLIHEPRLGDTVASVELAFHAFSEGKSHDYRVRRAWRDSPSGVKEQMQVEIDGVADQARAETWADYVEGFLPRGIAGLFFFDGEQIESLANLERSRQVLSSALSSLLGLDLVDRLTTDLAVIRRRNRSNEVPAELRKREEEAQAAWDAARLEETEATEAVAVARNAEARAAKQLAISAEQYRAKGGDLFERRQTHDSRVKKLREERDARDDELREVAAEAAPFLQVASAVRQLAMQTRKESEGARQQVVLDVLGTRDRNLLDHLREVGVEAAVLKAANKFLDADRHQRQDAATTEPITGLAGSSAVDYLADQLLPDAERRLQALLTRRAETVAELEAAERLLQSIPDEDALAQVREAYDQAQEDIRQARAGVVRADERCRTLREQAERAKASYQKARERAVHADLAIDDSRRLTSHADRAQTTLSVLKTAITERHVSRIAEYVLESLRTLMRKENLITEISINPATYAIGLRGAAGLPLGTDQLSVGERQMLAVALLWGLARAARQPLPVVIDTPLGRLDSSHRGNLIERYFPYVSHQVILLSTDTEITNEARKQLSPYIGRSYRLEFDRAAAATTVHPGYFGEP